MKSPRQGREGIEEAAKKVFFLSGRKKIRTFLRVLFFSCAMKKNIYCLSQVATKLGEGGGGYTATGKIFFFEASLKKAEKI